MPPHVHFEQGSWQFPILLTLTLLFAASLYFCGWIRLRAISVIAIPAWRAGSFFFGVFLTWTAWGSPLAAYDHELLTAHMIKHLLLMTLAPPMIWLGEPLLVLWHGMPQHTRNAFDRVLQNPLIRTLGQVVTKPVVCWTFAALTLIAWHLPAVFTLGMRSAAWHAVEQTTFFASGLLFWWPVIHPWPSTSTALRWSILLYLFLATLPCDILSGFLAFSDRVAYPVYFSAPRMFGFSPLVDQQCAAALMWTCVTVVYLVAGAILTMCFLSPRAFPRVDVIEPKLRATEFGQRA